MQDAITKTPVSNTGSDYLGRGKQSLSEGLTVGIDYFRGTVWLPSQSWVEEFVNAFMKLMDDTPVWQYNTGSYNGIQWAHKGHSIKGVKWWWNNPGDGQSQAHLLIDMSGSVVSRVPIRKFWQFCKDILLPNNFKVTRLDIAIDDYQKRINERDVMQAAQSGSFAVVKTISPYRTHKTDGTIEGFTWYFGSMKSDNFARFYDKGVESKGEIDSYRLEGQFTKAKAHLVWLQWLAIQDSSFGDISPRFLSGSVLGLVEFVDRNSRKGGRHRNIDRMNRLSWWQQFINACGCHIRHSVPREDVSLERAMRWLEKQVFGTLAAVQKAIGVLEFRRWLDEGLAQKAANFTSEQMAKVVQWSKGKSDIQQRTNGAVDKVEDGTKWIWVYRRNGSMCEWTLARLYEVKGAIARVRSSGEKAISVPRLSCHFGADKPTWTPRTIASADSVVALQT